MADFDKSDPRFYVPPSPSPPRLVQTQTPPPRFDVRDQSVVVLIEPRCTYEKTLFDFESMCKLRLIRSIAVSRISCNDDDWLLLLSKGQLFVRISNFQDKVPVWWMRESRWNPPHRAFRGERVLVALTAPPLAATSIIGFGIENEMVF